MSYNIQDTDTKFDFSSMLGSTKVNVLKISDLIQNLFYDVKILIFKSHDFQNTFYVISQETLISQLGKSISKYYVILLIDN